MKGKGKAKKKPSVTRTIKDSASTVIDEVESAGEVVLGEIKGSFDFIGDKVTDTAKFAADTNRAVTRKETSKDTTRQIQALLKEVEQAGESLLAVIGNQFDSLKDTVLSATGGSKPAPKSKKKITRKKAAAKKTTAKKAATRKKAPAKKATTRKKAPAKKAATKKAATRKKAAAKKTATRKKAAPLKKAAAKKAAPRKKTATARKTAVRKKTTRRKKTG